MTFPGKTVTGTENLLMAAALADGTTVLRNCALEPEVADLVALLREMGADISSPGRRDHRHPRPDVAPWRQPPHHPRPHRSRHLPDRRLFRRQRDPCRGGVPGAPGQPAGHPGRHGRRRHRLGAGVPCQGRGGAGAGRGGHRALSRLSHRPAGPADHAADPGRRGFPGQGDDLQRPLPPCGRTEPPGGGHRGRRGHGASSAAARGCAAPCSRPPTCALRPPWSSAAWRPTGETIIENSYQLFRGYENMPEKLQKLGAAITIIRE